MSHLIDIFLIFPGIFLGCIFILGLLIGSFLNVVIHRLPIMMEKDWKQQCCELLELDQEQSQEEAYNLIVPRSRCPYCQHEISALENIPVISYLFLRGKCKNCSASISIRYPLIEIVTALVSVIVAYSFGPSIQTVFALLLSWSLIALSMIDIDHQLLPDDITLPLLWLGIGISFFELFANLEASVLGAIFGYGSLWLVYIIFKLVTGKQGMGHGDFKLLGMFGAWLGYQYLPLIIVMSSLVGAVIGISMIIFLSHDRSKPIPFGPYLAIAGWICLIWGQELLSAYYRLFI
ncbi:MAG: A24 family peptidase [Pseudomonadota bacterium]